MRLLAYIALVGLLYGATCSVLSAAQPTITPGARLLLGEMNKEEFIALSKFEPDQPHLALHKARPIEVPKPVAAKRLALNTQSLTLNKSLSNNPKNPLVGKPTTKKTVKIKSQPKPKTKTVKKKTTTKKTTKQHANKKRSSHHR